MHRSRLTSIVIDRPEDLYYLGRDFWSNAFGRATVTRDDRFSSLKGRIGEQGGIFVGFQKVPPQEIGIHVDIETDNVDAEVARLEGLGATVKERIRRHVIMESPSGHAFCVIPVKRTDFPDGATEWP